MKTHRTEFYRTNLKSLEKDGRYYKNIARTLSKYISDRLGEFITVTCYKYNHFYEVHLHDINNHTIFWGGYFKFEKHAWRSFCEDVIGIGECGQQFSLNYYLFDENDELIKLLPENLCSISELDIFLKCK